MSAFSNGTEFQAWQSNWCDRCEVDADFRNDKSPTGCDILLRVICDQPTPELMLNDRLALGDQYHCVDFRPEGSGPPGPAREPDPMPGQSAMFDPEPLRRATRMWADVVTEATQEVLNANRG